MATRKKTAKKGVKKAPKKVAARPAKKVAKKTAGKATGKTAAKTPARPITNAASAKPKTHPIKTPPLPRALDRLRAICLGLPETHEELAWGEPTFRVKGKIFAMHASSGNHHGAGRPGVWILSVPIEQDMVLRARPDKYFKPPYVGPSGWIGAWLDGNPPWTEIEELLRDGWRRRAPKKIAALLGD